MAKIKREKCYFTTENVDLFSYKRYSIDELINSLNDVKKRYGEKYIELEDFYTDDGLVGVFYIYTLESDESYDKRLKEAEHKENEKEYQKYLKLKKKFENT